MKHIYKLLLAMLLCIVPASQMHSRVLRDSLYYNIDETSKTAAVSRQSNVSGDLVIPSAVEYNGSSYQVTSIGSYAFYNCSGLTSITIPESVTSIGYEAFSNCSGLTSITIPESVTSIGNSAFDGTPWYHNQPDGLICIGKVAYKYKGDMPQNTSITIPASVTSIGDYAFWNCDGLTSITIPESVTSIGYSAFTHCSGLTSVTIPASVTSIGDYAFDGCSSLTSITIQSGVTSIGEYAFRYCIGLTSVTIQSGVTSIGDWAFSYCHGLTSITIPKSVTSIGDAAFSLCSGLVSIIVESGNVVYDSRDNCNAIIHTESNSLISGCQNTIIPDSVTSIGDYAFCGCISLTSITIPESVTSIGSDAFKGCIGLTSITIPEGVTSIGRYAFSDCSGLTSITIPEGVTSIGSSAFSGCRGLTSITIPASVTSIGSFAFWNCSGLTSITIPEGVTSIGYSTFSGCRGLTSITIPASVTSIGNYAFRGCSGLTSITIPESVTSIDISVFEGCSGLTSITIPEGLTSIGSFAFSDCSNLETVTILAESLESYGTDAFEGTAEDLKIYVPAGSVDTYKAAWADYADKIVAIPVTVDVTLTDGDGITALSSHTGQTITVAYTRSFTEGKTSTVCLPFAYTKKEGDGSFYAFTNIEKEGSEYVATMTEPGTTTLEANTPYLYLPNATGDVDFGGAYTIPASLTAGSTTSGDWTFQGTFETIEWTDAPAEPTYGFSAQDQDGIYQGEFVKVGSYVRIKPMRAYLEYIGSDSQWAGVRGKNRVAAKLPESIKVRLIGADGTVTAIGSLSTTTGEMTMDGAWYSINGTRLNGTPATKGIYVNNGKKVVIK